MDHEGKGKEKGAVKLALLQMSEHTPALSQERSQEIYSGDIPGIRPREKLLLYSNVSELPGKITKLHQAPAAVQSTPQTY